MRFVWLSDLHLDFVNDDKIVQLSKEIVSKGADGILISGDISNSYSIKKHIKQLYNIIKKPIYFVTGNHDYYGSNINYIDNELIQLSDSNADLIFLNYCSDAIYFEDFAVIGHSSWYDGKYGNYMGSNVVLNDCVYIEDFSHGNKETLLNKYQKETIRSINHFEKLISMAFSKINKILLITHIPPFKESAVYNGKQSDNNYLPFFSSKSLGNFLVRTMKKYTDKQMLVLCGHSHGSAEVQKLKNLKILTGSAEYRNPKIISILNTNSIW